MFCKYKHLLLFQRKRNIRMITITREYDYINIKLNETRKIVKILY